MKITDEIKTVENDGFTQEQKEDMFIKLVSGKDVTEDVETTRGMFTIKYPKAKDKVAIGRLIAMRHSGIPSSSFDGDTELIIKMVSTLDVLVVSGAAWFEIIKKQKTNFSWEDIPDTKFISEVFVKIHTFRQKVEESLSGMQKEEADRVSSNTGNIDSMGNGLFEGLSGSSDS